jgi:DNA repair exonuclease SbcCD ATPase subunit
MSDHEDLIRRVERLEETQDEFSDAIHQLNTTVALLNKTVEMMTKAEEKREAIRSRGLLFIVGGFVSAVITWIVSGGLSQ